MSTQVFPCTPLVLPNQIRLTRGSPLTSTRFYLHLEMFRQVYFNCIRTKLGSWGFNCHNCLPGVLFQGRSRGSREPGWRPSSAVYLIKARWRVRGWRGQWLSLPVQKQGLHHTGQFKELRTWALPLIFPAIQEGKHTSGSRWTLHGRRSCTYHLLTTTRPQIP